MTGSTLAASSEEVRLELLTETEVLFIDWPLDDPGFPTCQLFDAVDFANCELVFFDPLQFAISQGLVSPEAEISNMSYVSFDEKEFLRYLGRTRKAAETLQRLLDNGGFLILRSNIPKASIKVRKKSSTGTTTYTDSVVSAFFWLEDILGVYSLSYTQANTVKYVQKNSPLQEVFGKAGVRCVQTLSSAGRGRHEVIATSGRSAKSAVISKLSFSNIRGQIFLVPKFIVGEEHKSLVEAFHQISIRVESKTQRSNWLDYYEKQVVDYSPQRPLIDSVELEMEALKKQLTSLLRKQEVYAGLVELLSGSTAELETPTRTAIGILGFECLHSSTTRKAPAFEIHPAGDKSSRFMVRVAHSENGPITADEVEALSSAVKRRTSALKAKGILIGNPSRHVQPEQREVWFDEAAVEAARRLDICLMPSLVLFTMVCYLMTRHDAKNIDALRTSMRRDIAECHSVFVLSRKKYAI